MKDGTIIGAEGFVQNEVKNDKMTDLKLKMQQAKIALDKARKERDAIDKEFYAMQDKVDKVRRAESDASSVFSDADFEYKWAMKHPEKSV